MVVDRSWEIAFDALASRPVRAARMVLAARGPDRTAVIVLDAGSDEFVIVPGLPAHLTPETMSLSSDGTRLVFTAGQDDGAGPLEWCCRRSPPASARSSPPTTSCARRSHRTAPGSLSSPPSSSTSQARRRSRPARPALRLGLRPRADRLSGARRREPADRDRRADRRLAPLHQAELRRLPRHQRRPGRPPGRRARAVHHDRPERRRRAALPDHQPGGLDQRPRHRSLTTRGARNPPYGRGSKAARRWHSS